jgi:hypothetical protein
MRRATLTLHVLCAVGWFGAVVAYLVLALTGLSSADPLLVRGSYTAMAVIGWWVVAPASGAALFTGAAQGLGTAWGLTRHWWVLLKLGMTLFAALALIVHLQPTSLMAETVRTHDLGPRELLRARWQLVVAPSLALILLAFNATLGIAKPQGITPFSGRRAAPGPGPSAPRRPPAKAC